MKQPVMLTDEQRGMIDTFLCKRIGTLRANLEWAQQFPENVFGQADAQDRLDQARDALLELRAPDQKASE